MQFATPTTKTEMLSILKEIFDYYRFQPVAYDEQELTQLILPRMQFDAPTDEQLIIDATTLLSAKHYGEIQAEKRSISSKILELRVKLDNADGDAEKLIAEINALTETAIKKAQTEAVKKGVTYSNIVHEKIVELERERKAEVTKAKAKAISDKTNLQAQITSLETALDGTEARLNPVHQLEITAKAQELKAQAEKTEREVFEYNNGLYRKECEYANNLIRTKATLELQYMEIRSKGLSHEELIRLGYYNDVFDCITAYYDTISAREAYNDMLSETALIPYLGEYHTSVLQVYRNRALDEQENSTN